MSGRLRDALRHWRYRDVEREVDEELGFHFERTIAELRARGWSESAARAEAAHRFGDVARYRRELTALDRGSERRRRAFLGLAELLEDARAAARRVRRAPALALAVVATFALGIGANATMFGILDRLLLSPPSHIAEPDDVRRIYVERFVGYLGGRQALDGITFPDYADFAGRVGHAGVDAFAGVAAYSRLSVVDGRGAAADRLAALLVTGSYFEVLGTRAALGRFFGPADDRLGGAQVAVIGYGLWQRRYGGSADVLGGTLDLGGGPYTIIGVAPEGFTGVDLHPIDVWLPMMVAGPQLFADPEEWRVSRGWYILEAVARLNAGVAVGAAEAEATAFHRAARAEQIDAGDYDAAAEIVLEPLILARGVGAEPESRVALWLAGVSLLLLVIVCANVANLLLARAVRGRRESALRLALGIGRARLLRQVVLESLALAALGGGAALVVTIWGGAALRGLLFPDLSWADPEAATRLFGFIALAALVAGVATGIVPALQAASPDVLQALKGGGRGASERATRARNVLIAFQAGLSVLLLIGAGLFVRSLAEVRELDLGLDVDHLLVVEPALDATLDDAARRRFYLRVSETIEAVPGIRGATAAVATPFMNSYSTRIEAEGIDSIPDVGTGGPYIYGVQPDFFEVLGQRILRGRIFTTADARVDAARVTIVNASMARRVWPGQDPLGRCLFIGDDVDERRCTTVVGVAADARREDLIESETLAYYVPFPSAHMSSSPPDALIVRAALEPGDVVDDVRRALHAAEPALRYARIRPMRELLAPEARAWTLGATMFSVFGVLALLVAGIGLYSVLAFAVAERRREIGIRAALGAAPARIARMVIGQALRVAGLGIALGLLVALAAAPRLADLLYRVPPRDPVVFTGVALALLAVAALAGALPALRATRVDPQEALRSE